MLHHTLQYLAVRVANGLLAVGTLSVFTHALTTEQFGRYSLGLAAANVIASIGFQWIAIAANRFHAGNDGDTSALRHELRRLWLIAAGLIALLGLSVAGMSSQFGWILDSTTVVLVTLGALAMGLFNLQLQLVNAAGKPLRYGQLTVSRAALLLVLGYLLALQGGAHQGVLLALSVSAFVAVAAFGMRFFRAAGATANPDMRGKLVRFGMPLALVYASTMTIDMSDRFLLGAFHGSAAVAGYSAAYDLAQQSLGALLNVFMLAGFPQVVAAWERGGRDAAQGAMRPMIHGVLLVGGAATSLFVGCANEVSHLIFSPHIAAEARDVLPWIAAATAIGGLRNCLFDVALQLEHRTATQFKITLFMAATNIVLCLLLVPRHEALGAAWSAFGTLTVGAAITAWTTRHLGFWRRLPVELLKVVACAALSIAAVDLLTRYWLPPDTATFLTLCLKGGGVVGLFALLALLLNAGEARRGFIDLFRKAAP